MMTSDGSTCLRGVLEEKQTRYVELLAGDGPVFWDFVVLTAFGDEQARLFAQTISDRLELGLLPRLGGLARYPPLSDVAASGLQLLGGGYAVLADPPGTKIGCGGATLRGLWLLERLFGDGVRAARTLVVHGGGYSKRIPHHSVLGKVFAALPHHLPGRWPPLSLFELKLLYLIDVPAALPSGGVWITAGDVLEVFRLPEALAFDERLASAVCIAHPAPLSTGTRHGVFESPPGWRLGVDGATFTCQRYHHKAPAHVLRACALLGDDEQIWIDGNIYLAPSLVALLAAFYAEHSRHGAVELDAELDAYGDVLRPLARHCDDDYIDRVDNVGTGTPALPHLRRALFAALQPLSLAVAPLQPSAFVHLGTTAEYQQHMADTLPAHLSFAGCALSSTAAATAVASSASATAHIGSGSTLEFSSLCSGAVLGRHCVVVDSIVAAGLVVPDHTFLYTLPLRNGRTAALAMDSRCSLKDDDLWSAAIVVTSPSSRTAVARALARRSNDNSNEDELLSFADCCRLADHERMRLQRLLRTYLLSVRPLFERQQPVDSWPAPLPQLLQFVQATDDDDELLLLLLAVFDCAQQALVASRLLVSLGCLFEAASLRARGAAALRDYVVARTSIDLTPLPAVRVEHVALQLPARVILAGGWSDTPPYTLERSGGVVNFALSIGGRRPIAVSARRGTGEALLRIVSRDQQATQTWRHWRELCDAIAADHTSDALTLHRCAVYVLLRGNGEALFEQLLGVELATDVDLPKGSGLGTSSILVAGCLRALQRLLCPDRPLTLQQETDAVLAVEQLMGSGGGWQDQVGGTTPGLKFVASRPSDDALLHYALEPIAMSPQHVQHFNQRLLAVYTGRQRVAQRVLGSVVERWHSRCADVVAALADIAASATTMRDSFVDFARADTTDDRDRVLEQLGRQLDHIRELNVRLEPVAFLPPELRPLFELVAPFVFGAHLIGAGNGGYLVGFLRPAADLAQLAHALEHHFPDCSTERFQLDVDDV